MAVKVIVELRAKPGRRGELEGLLARLIAEHGPAEAGYLGSTRYEELDDPDVLLEIAEWESPEARSEHMKRSVAAGVYAPVLELLAAPFRATVIRQLP